MKRIRALDAEVIVDVGAGSASTCWTSSSWAAAPDGSHAAGDVDPDRRTRSSGGRPAHAAPPRGLTSELELLEPAIDSKENEKVTGCSRAWASRTRPSARQYSAYLGRFGAQDCRQPVVEPEPVRHLSRGLAHDPRLSGHHVPILALVAPAPHPRIDQRAPANAARPPDRRGTKVFCNGRGAAAGGRLPRRPADRGGGRRRGAEVGEGGGSKSGRSGDDARATRRGDRAVDGERAGADLPPDHRAAGGECAGARAPCRRITCHAG